MLICVNKSRSTFLVDRQANFWLRSVNFTSVNPAPSLARYTLHYWFSDFMEKDKKTTVYFLLVRFLTDLNNFPQYVDNKKLERLI
jgi:hypothetical protein